MASSRRRSEAAHFLVPVSQGALRSVVAADFFTAAAHHPFSGLNRIRLGLAPSSPSRFLLSASYS
jgi:hypothetical protein